MILNHQLNLRLRHPDYQIYLDINEKESKRVRKDYNCLLDQKYGKADLQRLDIFPAKHSNSPILLFIHGGYWRALDKSAYSFIAEPFLKNNFTVGILNYRLLPSVNMEVLLQDIKNAVIWIKNNALQYNGDPNRLILSGHSAGGHLALLTYWANKELRPSIQAICSLSGIFDLQPIKDSYLNDVLQLNEEDVKKYSLINKDLSVIKCPTLLSVGSGESDFFMDQSKKLYLKNKSEFPIQFHKYEGLNHYQIVHKLGQEDNPLIDFIRKNSINRKSL